MPNSLTLSSMRITSRALTASARGIRDGDPRRNEDLCLNLLIEEGHIRYDITLSPDDARQLAGWINETFPSPKNAREVIDTLPVGTCFRLVQAEVVQFYRKVTENTVQEYANDTFDTPVDGGQWFLDTAPWLFTGWPVDEVTVYEPRTTTNLRSEGGLTMPRPSHLTQKRVKALLAMADRGLFEFSTDYMDAYEVDITSKSDAAIREDIDASRDATPEEAWEAVQHYRAALAAVEIIRQRYGADS